MLRSALTAVRTRRNQDAAINHFPPEILAAVFDYVRRNRKDSSRRDIVHDEPDAHSLIAVTHVCHHWRTVALDFSFLWTHVAAYSRSAHAFSQRARGAMITTVSAAVIRGQAPRIQKKLLWQLRSQIRALTLTMDTVEQLRVFRNLLRELSGSLEELTIVNRAVNKASNVDAAGNMHAHGAPMSLFGGRCASLKSLSISSGYALIPTDDLPTLAHLHLSNFKFHGLFLNDLPGVLLSAPSLQSFHLHLSCSPSPWAIPSITESYSSSGPIYLPSMQRFCITSLPNDSPSGGYIHAILSLLVFPHGAVVTIKEARFTWNETGPRLFAPHGVGPDSDTMVTIDKHGTMVITRGDVTYVSLHRGRIISWGGSTAGFDGHSVDKFTSYRQAKCLRIQATLRWSPGALGIVNNLPLTRLAAYTPNLTELVLRDFGRGELLLNLTDMLEHPEAVLCPKLATVVFITLATPKFGVAEVLFRATIRRAGRGYPLKRLTFCSPYNAQEYTLHNAHGAELVTVLSRDVWSEYDTLDHDIDQHWQDVRDAQSQRHQPHKHDYSTLWRMCIEGDSEPPAERWRVFGGYGHDRKWP